MRAPRGPAPGRTALRLLPLLALFAAGLALTPGAAGASGSPEGAAQTAWSPPLLRQVPGSRYLVDPSGKPVYLTGAHTWNNFQDIGDSPFDFNAYLDYLGRYNHNFIRLWVWEQSQWGRGSNVPVSPLPFVRTGPGIALDRGPRFDLAQFNPEYFDRLRTRVIAAGERGIYVSIMLFNKFSIQDLRSPEIGDPWVRHPFNRQNNVNGVDGDPNNDGIGGELQRRLSPGAIPYQEAYVRKVVDTVNDLDNVMFEIDNEGYRLSAEWQYSIIDLIHAYERDKPKQHPVWMSVPDINAPLWDSPAEVIAPGFDGVYNNDPPAADGRKVTILDTDHLWGVGGDQAWVWKSFLRGNNPIFMDPYDGSLLGTRGWNPRWEPVLRNMGYTRRYAERLDLAAALPRGDLASTGYALANPGSEYLVYLPNGGSVAVDLSAGAGPYSVEWFNPTSGETVAGGTVAGGARTSLTAPFAGDAVLYLAVMPPAPASPPLSGAGAASDPPAPGRGERPLAATGYRVVRK